MKKQYKAPTIEILDLIPEEYTTGPSITNNSDDAMTDIDFDDFT